MALACYCGSSLTPVIASPFSLFVIASPKGVAILYNRNHAQDCRVTTFLAMTFLFFVIAPYFKLLLNLALSLANLGAMTIRQ